MGFLDKYPYTNWHNVNLDWVLERVKEWGEMVEANDKAFKDLEEANASFKEYVTNYLHDLDVQVAIDDKLDRMFESGLLGEYLQPYVSPVVTTWLNENITEPEGVIIDSSLTVSGACADAKATGDKINNIENELNVTSKITPMERGNSFFISDLFGNVLTEYKNDDWISRRFANKKLSVLGDSISTYNGYTPNDWHPYYPQSNVDSFNKMWFSILTDNLGSMLLTSASCGGSTICGNTQDTSGLVMCSQTNINALAVNGDTPDIIIIFGGTNDWGTNKDIGDFNYTSELPSSGLINNFGSAYAYMLNKIMSTYPNAVIYCCTIIPRKTNDTTFPVKNNKGNTIAEFNKTIREVAAIFGVNIIDFDLCGINLYNIAEYTIDNLHPNEKGHKALAEIATKNMLK